MSEFSVFASTKGIFQIEPTDTIDIYKCVKSIRTLPWLIEKTTQLRQIPDPKEQQEFKKTLPYVTFSGTFTSRANENLVTHSGYLCIDLDHLKDTKAVAEEILAYYTPALMFVSASGNGLKVVFAVNINEGTHLQYFTALETFFKTELSLPVDGQCKDVSRACFLCHDADAFYSETPDILGLEFISKGEKTEQEVFPTEGILDYDDAKKWTESKETFLDGNRNRFIVTLADCCNRYGIDEQEALTKIITDFATGDFTAEEITTTVRSRYGLHQDWHGKAVMPVRDCPYVRIGTDYFKVINTTDRYGIVRRELKHWNKDTLITDYGRKYPKAIPKYDGFIMRPDNLNYRQKVNDSYNLYNPFCHTPAPGDWTWTRRLLEHVFGEQYEIGIRYMQILFLHPDRQTVILVLVSAARGTGKTTVLNWLNMLFGDNMILLSSTDFLSSFNFYAKKNIITVEETLFEKKLTVERLKSLATQKHITINEKFIPQFMIPFYGKLVLTSNYEDRFAMIDSQEIRFLVRKLGKPAFTNHAIEDDLLSEIPAFIYYLKSLPPVDWSVSRSGFTADELKNENLTAVVKESRHGISKEMDILITEHFDNHPKLIEFDAAPTDLRKQFFPYDNRNGLGWLIRALKEDFDMMPTDNPRRYIPFNENATPSKTGRYYKFLRENFTEKGVEDEDAPF